MWGWSLITALAQPRIRALATRYQTTSPPSHQGGLSSMCEPVTLVPPTINGVTTIQCGCSGQVRIFGPHPHTCCRPRALQIQSFLSLDASATRTVGSGGGTNKKAKSDSSNHETRRTPRHECGVQCG